MRAKMNKVSSANHPRFMYAIAEQLGQARMEPMKACRHS